MSKVFPQSLPAWILLILVVCLLAAQTATLLIAEHGVADTGRSFELFRLGERTMALAKLLTGAPAESRKQVLSQFANSSIALSLNDNPSVASAIPPDDELAELEDILVGKLARDGITDVRIKEVAASGRSARRESSDREGQGAVEQALSEAASDLASSGRFEVAVQYGDGQWLNFTVPVTPEPSILTAGSVPLYVGVAIAIVLLSLWAIRQLTAPYTVLERAVKDIGDDLNRPRLSETGSREAKAAARAINAMQGKLQDYVAEREHLAAALAHDLRTPLTRMRLRMELLKDARLRRSLTADLAEIEAITRSVVELANDEFVHDEEERIELVSLIEAVCDGFPQSEVVFQPARDSRVVCSGRPVALRRCLANLIDNAVKYGRRADVSLMVREGTVEIAVEDQGTGIPDGKIEDMFKPFTRLETSRNRQTGGMGLGLTIARSIARAHGGEVRMERREGAGMRAVLALPRPAVLEDRPAA
jgi:signal transduction histidine kinase